MEKAMRELDELRTLLNAHESMGYADSTLTPFLAIARKRLEAEIPYLAAALFLMSVGHTDWRDPIEAFSVSCLPLGPPNETVRVAEIVSEGI